ncbi:hypothetical protein [Streptomyces sp. SM12]|uniref:hypothetical protein n=1 Tax=Streptomyces sp. SM12 TaxID=1071602 RepID=UPI000CD587AE|nr:hypothetical protein [Streptomyces sp. SM12]
MNLTLTALFLITAAALAVWMYRDDSFRRREFLAVSLFWILAVATPWGLQVVEIVHNVLGTGAQTASDTINNLSK